MCPRQKELHAPKGPKARSKGRQCRPTTVSCYLGDSRSCPAPSQSLWKSPESAGSKVNHCAHPPVPLRVPWASYQALFILLSSLAKWG